MKIFRNHSGIRSAACFIKMTMCDSRITNFRPTADKSSRTVPVRPFRTPATLFMSLIFFGIPLLLLSPSTAKAHAGLLDDKKDAELRTVHGVVVDKNENGISSGIVYLENMKTQNVRTYITDDAGNYRFSGLDPNEDYEIHAEKGDLSSSTRTISSFDSRRDIEIVLKLIHQKK
jgi:hypothetical protein